MFLSPQWLADTLATVFTVRHTFVKRGLLHQRDLALLWKEPQYSADMREVLLDLFEQFEILYPLPESPATDKVHSFCMSCPYLTYHADFPDSGDAPSREARSVHSLARCR